MTQNKNAERKQAAVEEAFLAVDQVAEDLIRLIGHDPKYADASKAALKQIMKIKEDLIKAVR